MKVSELKACWDSNFDEGLTSSLSFCVQRLLNDGDKKPVYHLFFNFDDSLFGVIHTARGEVREYRSFDAIINDIQVICGRSDSFHISPSDDSMWQ